MAADIAGQRRRVHPATVGITTVRSLPVVGLVWFLLVEDEPPGSAPWLLLGLLLMAGAVLFMAFLGWRRLTFGFDADGDFRLDSGVVVRRERRLALSRLQSVDIVRPLVARLFGMASVRIEVAGDGAAVVEYLPEPQAEALREEVLRRAGGRGEPRDAGQASPPLLQVATADLLGSLLLRSTTMLALVITVAGTAGVVALNGFGGLLVVGFGVFVPLASVLAEFTSFYRFTLVRTADGVTIRSGLLSTRSRTVPPGRVHAIEVSQPVLWRRKDWVRVSMNIAGTGSRSEDDGRSPVPAVLLPVARRDDAMRILADLLPQWRIDEHDLEPAPAAARSRAWLQYRGLGVAVTDHLLVTRRGRLVRRTACVPHSHVQSVRLVMGPWQRALRLASVRADTVPGAVRVVALHRGADEARLLADQEAVRMRVARARSAAGEEGIP